MLIRGLGAVLLLVSYASVVQSAIVTETVTGTITIMNTGGPSGTPIVGGLGTLQVGDAFTATFSYDSTMGGIDLDPNAATGFYRVPSSADSFFSMLVDGNFFSTSTATGGILGVSTFNNVTSSFNNNTDALDVRGAAVSLPGGWSTPAATASITVVDPTGMALSDDSLPSTFSNAWSLGAVALSFNSGLTINGQFTNDVYIEGAFEISSVPEPSVLAFGAMLMPVSLLRRARRR